ncbi:response regulator [bacterium]|nr:response regulator [bacterium]
MKTKETIRVLLVEDDPTDLEHLQKAFADLPNTRFELKTASRLSEALQTLGASRFQIVLLDLNLPDSTGVETFDAIHRKFPQVPVLVLATAEDEFTTTQAVEQGAQDYLVKQQIGAPLLTRSIHYAIERSRLQQALAAKRQKEQQEREFVDIDRLSQPPGTAVTARIYSSGALRETAPDEFESFVDRYKDSLELALEQRIFKGERTGGEQLQALADDLGLLRASPRDVIEIHSNALKQKVNDVPWQKSQAFLQEGRFLVLELMGYLTGFYRSHAPMQRIRQMKS